MGRVDLIRVVRVPILLGGALGYGLGVLLGLASGGTFNPRLVAVCYLVVALGDLSTHYSNDYYDVELDRLAPRKMFGGDNLLVARGDLRSSALLSAEVLSLVSILLSGAAVLFGAPFLFVPLAVGANLLGWSYSVPRVRLSHRGLGEAAIAIGTGFGVPAAGYLAVRGTLDPGFLLFALPLILYGFVLSLCLELPDAAVDASVGKLSVAVRLGSRPVQRLMLLFCLSSTILLYLFSGFPSFVASLAPLSTVAVANIVKQGDRSRIDLLSASCIVGLFVFLVAVDGYLLVSTLL